MDENCILLLFIDMCNYNKAEFYSIVFLLTIQKYFIFLQKSEFDIEGDIWKNKTYQESYCPVSQKASLMRLAKDHWQPSRNFLNSEKISALPMTYTQLENLLTNKLTFY